MGYLGRSPTPSPIDSSDIPANSIDASKIIDGAIAVADVADNAITEAKIADAAVVSLKSGRRNLIINGDFQVSQRGDYTTATTASGSTYYLDRFKTVLGGAFTYTHKISQLVDGKYVNTLLQTMTATGYSATQQFVEDFAKLKGQTVTLSVWVKSNKAGASVGIYDGVSQTQSSPHTGGGGWEKLTVSHTCSTSTTLMRTEVWTTTGAVVGSFIEFTNFQLEVGSVATDFEHRSYGEELALCQRYYEKGNLYRSGWVTSGTSGVQTTTLLVEKRVTPTFSITSTGSLQNATGVTLLGGTKHSIIHYPTGGGTAHLRYQIGWTADAEL